MVTKQKTQTIKAKISMNNKGELKLKLLLTHAQKRDFLLEEGVVYSETFSNVTIKEVQ